MARKHQDIAEDIAGRFLRQYYGADAVRHTGPGGDRAFRVAHGPAEIAVEVKLLTDQSHQQLQSDWARLVDLSTPLDTGGLTRSWLVSLSLPMIGEPAPTPHLRTFRRELVRRLEALEAAGIGQYLGDWPGFATDDAAAREALMSMRGVSLLAFDPPAEKGPEIMFSTSWGGAASLDGERILATMEAWLASEEVLATRLRDRLKLEPTGVAFLVLWVAAPDSWRFEETMPPDRPPELPSEMDGLWLSSVGGTHAWRWSTDSGWSVLALTEP